MLNLPVNMQCGKHFYYIPVLSSAASSEFISGVVYACCPKANFTIADWKHYSDLWVTGSHFDKMMLVKSINPFEPFAWCFTAKTVFGVRACVSSNASLLDSKIVWALMSHIERYRKFPKYPIKTISIYSMNLIFCKQKVHVNYPRCYFIHCYICLRVIINDVFSSLFSVFATYFYFQDGRLLCFIIICILIGLE